MISREKARRWSAVLMLPLVLFSARQSSGAIIGIEADDNDVYMTHVGGFGGAPVLSGEINTPFVVPPNPAPMQFDSTLPGPGGNTSTGRGGVSHYFQPNRVSISLAPGTGISQSAPAGGNGPAWLEIEFDDIDYDTDAGGFGPYILSWYRFHLVGNVGAGGYVQFILDDMEFGNRRDFNLNWINTTPGPFNVVLTGSKVSPGYYDGAFEGGEFEGSIFFVAKNDGEPSSITCEDCTITPEPTSIIPEPATWGLLAVGMLALMACGRRSMRR